MIKSPCRDCGKHTTEFPKCYQQGCIDHEQYVLKIPHDRSARYYSIENYHIDKKYLKRVREEEKRKRIEQFIENFLDEEIIYD